jgi:type II secretory pathway component PulJ
MSIEIALIIGAVVLLVIAAGLSAAFRRSRQRQHPPDIYPHW